MIGEMRLGGMIPATYSLELPATFRISKKKGDTFFCNHDESEGDTLRWVGINEIEVRGQRYKLKCSPSYRSRWCTFTIS